MKTIKVRTSYVPDDCNYLTPGKVYVGKLIPNPVIQSVTFTGDDGGLVYANLKACAHLDGGTWEVLDE